MTTRHCVERLRMLHKAVLALGFPSSMDKGEFLTDVRRVVRLIRMGEATAAYELVAYLHVSMHKAWNRECAERLTLRLVA